MALKRTLSSLSAFLSPSTVSATPIPIPIPRRVQPYRVVKKQPSSVNEIQSSIEIGSTIPDLDLTFHHDDNSRQIQSHVDDTILSNGSINLTNDLSDSLQTVKETQDPDISSTSFDDSFTSSSSFLPNSTMNYEVIPLPSNGPVAQWDDLSLDLFEANQKD
jgi:hypothetical protein